MSSDIASLSSSLPQSTPRPPTPPHFDAVIRTESVAADPSTKRKRMKTQYRCRSCINWGPSSHRVNTIGHVIRNHPLPLTNESSVSSQLPRLIQPDIATAITSFGAKNALRNAFNEVQYREALIGLLTRRRMAFSSVEWPELQDLVLAANPTVADHLITNRRTAIRHIAANYQLYRLQLQDQLSSARSLIHISSDLWTSPNRSSLLGVCAQWVNSDYSLQKALLALPECRYSHSGEKQAQLILSVLQSFDIQKRIGYHTGDNASSNDTCLEYLGTRLRETYNVGSFGFD